MLISASDLRGFRISAADRELGSVRDVYFDDADWTVRYIVVDSRGWLSGRQVLVSPVSAALPNLYTKHLPLRVSSRQIAGSPPVGARVPLSREREAQMAEYYGWPAYWRRSHEPAASPAAEFSAAAAPGRAPEANLHGAEQVIGYLIRASDAATGHLSDLVIDHDWRIRYLIVKTRHLLPGGNVVLEREWTRAIFWTEHEIAVDLPNEIILNAPTYSGELREEDEPRIRQYYAQWAAAA